MSVNATVGCGRIRRLFIKSITTDIPRIIVDGWSRLVRSPFFLSYFSDIAASREKFRYLGGIPTLEFNEF